MIVARSSAPSWGRCNADVRTVAPTRSQKKTPQESKKSDNKSGFVIEYGAIMELCVPVPSSVPRMRRLAPRVAASVHRCQPASSDPRRSDVKDGFPGELRVQLCRCKNNGFTGGTIPVANAGVWFTSLHTFRARLAWGHSRVMRSQSEALRRSPGIFVKNIVQYILRENQGIFKMFNLFTKDGNGAGGQVQLKLVCSLAVALPLRNHRGTLESCAL